MQDDLSTETVSKASLPSLIQSFSIEGLHGYRNISLSSQHAATVLIARNGSGKTTLLGALDAFLRLQFSRLSNIEFSKIVCSLRDVDGALVLTQNDVKSVLKMPTDVEFLKTATRSGVEPTALFTIWIV